jgi:hypothetical protein
LTRDPTAARKKIIVKQFRGSFFPFAGERIKEYFFRNHLIPEYGIPKYDGDVGIPNFFIRLDESLCRKKAEQLCRFFRSRANKHWFSEDTLLSLMRLRGIECASRIKYAEAFYCRKCLGH